MSDPLALTALDRILRPLMRLAMARGIGFPALADRLKTLYVQEAAALFVARGEKVTDSRIALLTGLQRREVKARRGSEPPSGQSAGVLPRIIARWRAGTPYAEGTAPRPLPRRGEGSFEALVAEISRDMHPRSALDGLLQLGSVSVDHEDRVVLEKTALLPAADEAALLDYMAANLGDHAEAAVANVLIAPDSGPFYERAVHYNHLSEDSLATLDATARKAQDAVLHQLSAEALALQKKDREARAGTGRFRLGAYIYREAAHSPEDEG